MKTSKEQLIDKLMNLDRDACLLDTTSDRFSCVIVGGGALVLMDKIYRSTHDIDSIDASDRIQELMQAYNINMNVKAYLVNFPDGYRSRLQKLDIDTKKVDFYTASLEDLVVSKLCSMRDKDIEDIENHLVYDAIDWDILDTLVQDVCYGMLNDYDEEHLKQNYLNYKDKFKK